MKNYIITLLICIFFIVSCQTIKKDQSDSQQPGEGEEVAADVIGGDNALDDFSGKDDLESEFTDSEDFEKEMANEAFPSDEEFEDNEKELKIAEEDAGSSEQKEPLKEEVAVTDEEQFDDSNKEGGAPPDTADTDDDDIVEIDEIDEVEIDVIADTDDIDETSTSSFVDSAGVVIHNIRYESGENKIYVDGTGPISYQSRENKENNQFIIEIPKAVLSGNLIERPFVMKDFNTAIALLQADQKDSDTVRIVMQMRENAGMPSVNVSETGSLVISSSGDGTSMTAGLSPGSSGLSSSQDPYSHSTGEVLPAKSLEEFFLHTPQFTGRPLSITLQDVSVREVLYFISEGTGLNMVLSDEVRGNISIKLRNVPWDQALVTVMKTKKLGYLREGNVIRIMSLESLRKDQENIKKMMDDQKTIDPLKVKVIPLIYTKAVAMKSQAEIFLTEGRGKVVVDNQSNVLIVTDTSRVIDRIETLIKNLDKSPMQVMIEAKVVEARESFVRDLGITWGFRGASLNITPGGNSQLALNVDGNLVAFPAARTEAGSVSGQTLSGGLNIGFAPVGDLDVTLGLSEAEGLANIISAPRIMVLNGEKATITQSSENISLATQRSNDTGQNIGTAAQRNTASLEFEVSPQITAVGSIFLDIRLQRQFFGAIADPQTQARPLNDRQAETKVLVQNGQTIVIGGIYHHSETRSDEGFPLLRHIPILKWFFSRVAKNDERNELLLFLTPRVLNFVSSENPTEIN